jgi:hypothetical protein
VASPRLFELADDLSHLPHLPLLSRESRGHYPWRLPSLSGTRQDKSLDRGFEASSHSEPGHVLSPGGRRLSGNEGGARKGANAHLPMRAERALRVGALSICGRASSVSAGRVGPDIRSSDSFSRRRARTRCGLVVGLNPQLDDEAPATAIREGRARDAHRAPVVRPFVRFRAVSGGNAFPPYYPLPAPGKRLLIGASRLTSGGGGIRTLVGGVIPRNGFRDRRIQPLCHPSRWRQSRLAASTWAR